MQIYTKDGLFDLIHNDKVLILDANYNLTTSVYLIMDVSVSVFRNIAYSAASKGANLSVLCDRVGVTIADLDDPEKRFSLDKVDALFYHGIEMTKDPLFGLHIGEKVDFSAFGIVGYMMQSSPDVITAIERACHYNNLVSEVVKANFEKKGDTAFFKTTSDPIVFENYPLLAKHGIEDAMSFIINAVQKLSGKKCLPEKVSFIYPIPKEHIKEYERIFPTSLVFNQQENLLVYRLKDLDNPVIGYNQSLFDLLNSQAQEISMTLSQNESFTQKVKKVIVSLFNYQFPTIELVALELNTSVRSLQRKLKAEGETYQDILDSIRKEFALKYLKNRNLSISEVAYHLGFSEPSVFSRSFKRWMGQSPKEYLAEKK